jgi:hypothetical protein
VPKRIPAGLVVDNDQAGVDRGPQHREQVNQGHIGDEAGERSGEMLA